MISITTATSRRQNIILRFYAHKKSCLRDFSLSMISSPILGKNKIFTSFFLHWYGRERTLNLFKFRLILCKKLFLRHEFYSVNTIISRFVQIFDGNELIRGRLWELSWRHFKLMNFRFRGREILENKFHKFAGTWEASNFINYKALRKLNPILIGIWIF